MGVRTFILCAVGAARFAVACLAATWLAACGLGLNGLQTSDDAGPSLLDATGDVTMADASQESSSGADASLRAASIPGPTPLRTAAVTAVGSPVRCRWLR